jgi:rhodanese-related sulfurtransferase
MTMQQLSVAELKAWLDDSQRQAPTVLDVREAWERANCALPGSVHIPMGQIVARVSEIERSAPLVVMCHHGGRSMQVATFLARQGFDPIFNLAGGIHAWASEIDTSMATY